MERLYKYFTIKKPDRFQKPVRFKKKEPAGAGSFGKQGVGKVI